MNKQFNYTFKKTKKKSIKKSLDLLFIIIRSMHYSSTPAMWRSRYSLSDFAC